VEEWTVTRWSVDHLDRALFHEFALYCDLMCHSLAREEVELMEECSTVDAVAATEDQREQDGDHELFGGPFNSKPDPMERYILVLDEPFKEGQKEGLSSISNISGLHLDPAEPRKAEVN